MDEFKVNFDLGFEIESDNSLDDFVIPSDKKAPVPAPDAQPAAPQTVPVKRYVPKTAEELDML